MTIQGRDDGPPGLPVLQTRKDLYQAHRLMTQRAALALLRGQPDVPDRPMRRLNVAAFSGILVALIAAVLLIIWGLIAPSSVPLAPGHHYLITDSDTGTKFVFCEKDKLCPAVNYASALLALDVTDPQPQSVSQSALRSFPVGPQIGIPGLPDLPVPGLLVRSPWSVCDKSGAGRDTTTLAGGYATGGRRLGNRSLLVRASGQDWVIWHNTRHLIAGSLLVALSSQTPVSAAGVWLNALPEGAPFAPPQLAGSGAVVAGPLGPARVGQVYQVVAATGKQYYVQLHAGGLGRISPLQASLLEFSSAQDQPKSLSPGQASRYAHSQLPLGGLPALAPPVVTGARAGMRCVVYGAGGSSTLRRQVLIGGRVPPGAVPTNVSTSVTQIFLPDGTGSLACAAPAPGSAAGAVNCFLVSGGKRYALPSRSVAAVLGYQDLSRQAVTLPASVVALIPQGPVLSPAAARRQAPAG